ncbi:cell division protein SepF [Nakamurella sp. A5-74]|uniref:Cell division protein SepF n=1 Tax=Nakamurella sp. A5-74 TaxID=3158264 RepID=A0AAU8DKD5_9ACTN
MGTLRKMGAFLGLVPDESDRYAARGEQADHYAVDEQDGDHHPRYDGDDADYPVDGGDRAGYATDDYQRDDYAADASISTGVDAYGDYAADTHHSEAGDHGRRELEYAGRYADSPADNTADHPASDHAGSSPYTGADRSRPAEPRAHSALGGRRSKSGRGAGRQSEDVDYSTQGALAVQPLPAEVAAVDPASAKPSTVSLTGFADAREVGELYRTGQAVILDMTELTDAEARRMVDFAAGLAFAVRGSIDKVTTKVFMLHQPDGDTDRSGR